MEPRLIDAGVMEHGAAQGRSSCINLGAHSSLEKL